ncbi:MAG TPA: TlpA disulfide reductase family protein [bacterium]|nr:TlpA disulfide reductase family protein [bacterium]
MTRLIQVSLAVVSVVVLTLAVAAVAADDQAATATATTTTTAAPVATGAQGKAPDFALSNIDGKVIKLAELLKRGPVVVDFWATWCKPCIKGFPALQQTYDKYKAQGLTVVAIAVDSPKSQSRVAPFIKSQKFTFEVVLDTDGAVARKYNVVPIPRTLVLDREGQIVYSSIGYSPTNEEKLSQAVESILVKKASGEGTVDK